MLFMHKASFLGSLKHKIERIIRKFYVYEVKTGLKYVTKA